MELGFLMPEDTITLDPLYNHKTTCELLIQKGENKAIANFRQQSCCLDRLASDHLCELRCIFLNSLNRCLYNYILFTWDISLSSCCFKNKSLSHHFDSKEDFLRAGEKIIKRYAASLSFYPTKAAHISKACSYIEEHLNEDLSLSTVARHIYVSPCYLCKIFKPLTGQTFSAYVNEQRLIRARKMLLTTNSQIDHIAACCGFRSSSYFSTAFRKLNGITPVEFRNKYRDSAAC